MMDGEWGREKVDMAPAMTISLEKTCSSYGAADREI